MRVRPPNLWDWIHQESLSNRHAGNPFIRGIGRDELKLAYHRGKAGHPTIKASPLFAWIVAMFKEFDNQFTRKESSMEPKAIPPWQAYSSQSAQNCYPSATRAATPEELIADAAKVVAKAEADIAERERRDAFEARTQYEVSLAHATLELLNTVRGIELFGHPPSLVCTFAKFRKELSPLAESYGYRIKLVGDKSVAVLTKV